jgi:hypothetical protein
LHVYTVYKHYTLIFTALLHIKSPNWVNMPSLADFSAINYCLKLSHTSRVSCGDLTRRTAPYKLFPRTNCLDISVPLINPQSYYRHCCLLPGPFHSCQPGGLCYVTVFTGVALETSVLPCDVIVAASGIFIQTLLRDVIAAAQRRLRLPSPPCSVYSVASCLADAA